jgi:hypothetical protein
MLFFSRVSSIDMINIRPCPKFLSPNLWVINPMRFPKARKFETFPSLLLVHTEKVDDSIPLKFVNLGLKDWGLVQKESPYILYKY